MGRWPGLSNKFCLVTGLSSVFAKPSFSFFKIVLGDGELSPLCDGSGLEPES
jgi:hypothetical protein